VESKSPALQRLNKKHRSEIETMMKEVDKVVQLDWFLKKWSLSMIGSVDKDDSEIGKGNTEYDTIVRDSAVLAQRRQG